MKYVNTVLGPVRVDQLGRALMHEHLLISYPGWELDGRNSWQKERDLDVVSAEVAALRKFGVASFVDATPVDLGRNVEFMVEVAKRTGLNVIASTGLYRDDNWFPTYFRVREVDEIADWMVWELTEGIGSTGVKAGVIKCATSLNRVGPYEEKAVRAAARAHKRTGAPILTHCEDGTMGREQLDIFEQEGADLSRIVIGHSCCTSDLRYHLDILKRGAILGLDRIGNLGRMPDEIRAGVAATAIACGYASQVVFSQDIVGTYYGRAASFPPGTERNPYRTFTDLFTSFIPRLQEMGVGERAIDTVLADLPRKFFGG